MLRAMPSGLDEDNLDQEMFSSLEKPLSARRLLCPSTPGMSRAENGSDKNEAS